MVVLRGGCGWFGGVRLLICDSEDVLPIYFYKSGGFKEICIERSKSVIEKR